MKDKVTLNLRAARVLGLVALAFPAVYGMGCASDGGEENLSTENPTQDSNAAQTPVAAKAKDRAVEEWRRVMSKTPAPHDGCFEASRLSYEWKEVECITPPQIPYAPAHGGARAGAQTVGNGTDFSSEVSGSISWSQGSFPSVTGVTSESDSGYANDYSLQLNTNFFYGSPMCSGAANPSTCQAWEQFIYATGSGGFIQYWLINYSNTCPSGWNTYGSDCWRNSTSGVSVPSEPISDLASMTVTGTAGSSDSVNITTAADTLYKVSQATVVHLAGSWTASEFNIVGNGGGSQAVFNTGSTIVVQTLTDSQVLTTSAPTCISAGFTGETNNLNLVSGSCCAVGGKNPGIQFTQSNASSPVAAPCPSYEEPASLDWKPLSQRGGIDFDGDGKADPTIFRPSNELWSERNTSASWYQTYYGSSGDIAVPGDYDGDGKTDIATFTPSTGTWNIVPSSAPSSPYTVSYGVSGDIPVAFDYDGDGITDIAVFRPSTNQWFLRHSGTPWQTISYGSSGDIPVPADYDGDGLADIATFTPSTGTWNIQPSSASSMSVSYGVSGDIPVPADYDGDGKADIAVFRPSNSTWYLRNTGSSWQTIAYGASGDIPVPNDYDGDFKTDIAVFRPSTGTWYLRTTTAPWTNFSYGISGDVPLTLSTLH